MFSIEEFIIAVFCCVDDALKRLSAAQPIRSRGFGPGLRDAEVLTMELVGEYQGIESDKGLWRYFHHHWLSLFPELPTRTSFVRQAANLWQCECAGGILPRTPRYKQRLQHYLATQLGAFDEDVHLVDGLPMSLCCLTYAAGCRSFQGEASYGYCAAKAEFFYGFRGHLSISVSGVLTGFALTPANGDEREALWEMRDLRRNNSPANSLVIPGIRGLLIGDKGYLSQPLHEALLPSGVNLQTAMRSNMKDARPKDWVHCLQTFRRLIETVNGQLAERFHFERIRARDLWHLTSRIARKLLAHTLCCWLNRQQERPLLQFDGLLAD